MTIVWMAILIWVVLVILGIVLHRQEKMTIFSDFTDVCVVLVNCFTTVVAIFLLSGEPPVLRFVACCATFFALFFCVCRNTFLENPSVIKAVLSILIKYSVSWLYVIVMLVVYMTGPGPRRKEESDWAYEMRRRREQRNRIAQLVAGTVAMGIFVYLALRRMEWSGLGEYFIGDASLEMSRLRRGGVGKATAGSFVCCLLIMVGGGALVFPPEMASPVHQEAERAVRASQDPGRSCPPGPPAAEPSGVLPFPAAVFPTPVPTLAPATAVFPASAEVPETQWSEHQRSSGNGSSRRCLPVAGRSVEQADPIRQHEQEPERDVQPSVPRSATSIRVSALKLPDRRMKMNLTLSGRPSMSLADDVTLRELPFGDYSYEVRLQYVNLITGEEDGQVYTGSGTLRIRYSEQQVYIRLLGGRIVVN